MPRVSVGHFLIGVEGLAVLRTWLSGSEQSAARIEELRRILADTPLANELDVPVLDVETGYGRWAGTYDSMPNPLIHVEEPIVHALIDRVAPGLAVDAACGTGRHTRHLVARGHRVIGVDMSEGMLAVARAALPDADLRTGTLHGLPVETGTADLVVCSLALSHLETLGDAIAELARVLQPGGSLVLSDLHPVQVLIGGSAFFVGQDGRAGQVRSYAHPISTYLQAFRDAGLAVRRCFEPAYDDAEIEMLSGGMMRVVPDAFLRAYRGLPGALVWDLARS